MFWCVREKTHDRDAPLRVSSVFFFLRRRYARTDQRVTPAPLFIE
jgi:hypothetical protein